MDANLEQIKKELISDIQDEIGKLKNISASAGALPKNYHTGLPKVRLYYSRKADLKKLLRDYGYQGKVMESLIHKVDTSKSYRRENGNEYYARNQCNYLLYSDDPELNDELQITLTLDQTKSTILFMSERSSNSYFYGNVRHLTAQDISNMAISKKLSAMRELKYATDRKITELQQRITHISNLGNHISSADKLAEVLKLFQDAGPNKEDK